MDHATRLFQRAVTTAESFIASEIYTFTDRWDAARVAGKWFMIWESGVPTNVNLKAHPTDGQALRDEFPFITPGYHMNKKHWITVSFSDELSERLLEELVLDSYLNVIASMPKKHRPIDPETYSKAYRFRSPT